MTAPGPPHPAAYESGRQPESKTSQYSQLWKTQTPRLEDFVASCADVQPSELAALVRIDLRERLRRGEQPDARQYLEKFPALTREPELAVDVVYAEYLLREQLEQHPTPEEFAARFPEYAIELNDQIELHRAFAVGRAESAADRAPQGAEFPDDLAPSARSLEADYEILDELGRGGMGVVYRARQPALNRFVALKMVRRADLENDELRARFRAEAEVVASLHHPHIVQVYDYGEHEGAPYLALELVAGGSLGQWLDGTPWNPRRAAALLEQVARAVHFAHQRGVVHRDLKPGNLLVCGNVEPLEIKIADFGLARVFRDHPTAQTHSGTLLGTPSYMAPEQASGRAGSVGPATDVYALGAILYELLSGRPPYRGATALDTLQQLLLAEPASIHRLVPGLPRDLATICTKCLERTPERRYATALELADDLSRFLNDRPIHARQTGSWERGWRWCRRNPALAAALGSVAALLLCVTAVSTWYSGRLSRQLEITQRAELAERQAKDQSQLRLWNAYLAEISARHTSHQLGQRFSALETVARAQKLLPTIGDTPERQLQLRSAAMTSLALPDLQRAGKLWSTTDRVYNGALALAADRFALNVLDRTLVVGRVSDGAILATVEHQLEQPRTVMSPAGNLVGLSSGAETHVWRIVAAGVELAWQRDDCRNLSFAPDGRQAVVSRPGVGLELLSADSGETIRLLSDAEPQGPGVFHPTMPLLAFCTPREVRVIDWEASKLVAALPRSDFSSQLAWHPAGEQLAVWRRHEITLWDLRTRKPLLALSHPGFPQQIQFTADGARLVSCSLWDSRLMLWDVGSGQKELEVQGFATLAMDLDAEGKLCLLRNQENTVERWEVADGAECRTLPRAWYASLDSQLTASISADSRLLALGGDRGLEFWDLQRCQRLARIDGGLSMPQFDKQGNLIVASPAGIVRWPRRERSRAARGHLPAATIVAFGPPERLGSIAEPTSVATCILNDVLVHEDDDGWHATSLSDPEMRVALRPPGDPRKAALSGDDRIAAIAGWESGGASLWDVATGRHLKDLPIDRFGMVEFSPDGRWLATTPGGVQIWRTSDWTLAHSLHAQGTTPNGLGIGFARDSRVLAIGQPNGELRLVDPATGHDWARVTHSPPTLATLILFSPDNRQLLAIPADRYAPARIWNLERVRASLQAAGLAWPADVLRPAQPPASAAVGLIEIEWNDGGWNLLKSAVESLRSAGSKAGSPLESRSAEQE